MSTVREGDTVARMGGDEFIVVLPGLTNAVADTESIAEKVLRSIAAPVCIEGREFYISASIGITVFPDDGAEPDQLLRNADTAMYRAKSDGRNKYQFFTSAMNDLVLRRMEIETQLRFAVERNEMQVHFQPQVDLRTGRVIGAEALLRWHSPHFGDIAPRQFIPLAEDSGLIIELGEWVTRIACAEAKHWQTMTDNPVRISVNVSPRQIKDRGFNEKIQKILDRSQLSPDLLELELTESVLLEDESQTYDVLTTLKSLGIRLSLDDFGTGYSSLGYLKRYPFTALKIDRTFVTDIDTDVNDASLCVAIIALAKSLSLEVIGEGAETESQYCFLRDNGVSIVQGYYFSRPLTSEQFRQYLYEQNAVTAEPV
jgi:predicted signal transduction protein with EAL and GGDEF domain